jgi:hypothetical protein
MEYQMPKASFYTPDGYEIDIGSEDVVDMIAGDDSDTTVLELEDGSEIVVVATTIEVAAELRLNPLDYLDEEDDEFVDRLDDDAGDRDL